MFVLMLSTFDSLGLTQHSYYERYRFADVFASLKRAPLSLAADIARIPGVAPTSRPAWSSTSRSTSPAVERPSSGRLISVPDERPPRAERPGAPLPGRWVEPYRDDEVHGQRERSPPPTT